MVRLRPERYATEKAHKLHPRAAGPFEILRVINPNAYVVAIPPEWGISSTFNICDLVDYHGPLDVPAEPGLPPNSTELSAFVSEENDGDHTPRGNVEDNDLEPPTDCETTIQTDRGIEAVEERRERPRHLTKPSTRPSEYHYY